MLVISVFSHPLGPFEALGVGIDGFQQALFRDSAFCIRIELEFTGRAEAVPGS